MFRFLYTIVAIPFFYLRGFRLSNIYSSSTIECVMIYHNKYAPKIDEIKTYEKVISFYDLTINKIYRLLSIPQDKQKIVIMCSDLWIGNTTAYCVPRKQLILLHSKILGGGFDREWDIMNPQEVLLYTLLHEFGHILIENNIVREAIDERFANTVGFGLCKLMLPFICLQRYLISLYKYNVSGSRYKRSIDALNEFFSESKSLPILLEKTCRERVNC